MVSDSSLAVKKTNCSWSIEPVSPEASNELAEVADANVT